MLAVTITTVFLLWWDLWLTVVDRLTQTYWSLAKLLITLNLAHSRIATTKLRDTGTPSSVQIQNLNLQRNVFIQEKLISINRYHKKYINTLIPFLTSFQCFCLHGCNNNQPHSSIYPLLQKLLCLLYWKERKGCVSILIRKKIIILFQLNEQYNWHALIIINRSTHIEWYK